MAVGDDYSARNFGQAWQTLQNGCEIPPSLEVFDYELELTRRKEPTLTPVALARRLSESYHRVRGFFDDGQ